MEENNPQISRTGIHKHFHISKLDAYISAFLSVGFFVLVGFKLFNRIFAWGISTSYISWIDAMQLAILWAILGLISRTYYLKYEKKYDQ